MVSSITRTRADVYRSNRAGRHTSTAAGTVCLVQHRARDAAYLQTETDGLLLADFATGTTDYAVQRQTVLFYRGTQTPRRQARIVAEFQCLIVARLDTMTAEGASADRKIYPWKATGTWY